MALAQMSRSIALGVVISAAAALLLVCTSSGPGPLSSPSIPGSTPPASGTAHAERWFLEVGKPLDLSEQEAGALAERILARLGGRGGDDLPARLALDRAPRIAFVSIKNSNDGNGPARVTLGLGAGVAAAIDRATDEQLAVRGRAPARAALQEPGGESGGDAADAQVMAAGRALAYMSRFIEPFGRADQRMSVLAYHGKIKLGGVALAALALATHVEVTGQDGQGFLSLAQRLCRYIRHSQRTDGSFLHQREHPSGRPRDFISQY